MRGPARLGPEATSYYHSQATTDVWITNYSWLCPSVVRGVLHSCIMKAAVLSGTILILFFDALKFRLHRQGFWKSDSIYQVSQV
ncbi:hypothetical protein BDV28DRAFT_125463 [Aspergillus coremiiformis]|uniref:Uncharacterized protein n=1 Tax=Aspergillus coremiiformis TaxID=138285 RepID=A0A5N6Z5P2_9EURO|nr:hypothetical protein BDV28DRAFT_125463 [Aspergillus coremiiformis]